MKFYNGNEIPQLGLGTFLSQGQEVKEIVKEALKQGVSLIDTAAAYENEQEIGQAIKDSGKKREEIFLVSKLSAKKNETANVEKEYKDALNKLGVQDLDLFLIHWQPRSYETLLWLWRQFEDLYLAHKVKAIGVCNVTLYYLDRLLSDCRVKPMVVQVEVHPFLQQDTLLEYCQSKGIVVMGYGTFAKGLVFKNETLKRIADNHNVEIANVIIRYNLDRGIVMMPKTVHKERLVSNFTKNDFQLSEEEIKKIESLNDGLRVYRDPENNPFTA